jgi:hypothetical protein
MRSPTRVLFTVAAATLSAGCSGGTLKPLSVRSPFVAGSEAGALPPDQILESATEPNLLDCGELDAEALPETCDPADAKLESLERAIICGPSPSGSTAPRASWDRKGDPLHLDLVERRFGLTPDERAHLVRDGFVVPARLAYPSYLPALHDVYRSQLPLFVSVDAVLHAVYMSNDRLIAELESTALEPLLGETLKAMHETFAASQARYPADTAHDLDVYLAVARTLLSDKEGRPHLTSVLGTDKEVKDLVDLAEASSGMPTVNLFGRDRVIDFAAFLPRGHYASESANAGLPDLSHYFRSAMWLSRLEYNLVSRSSRSSSAGLDQRETPREATDAMALADLARKAGVMDSLDRLDVAWGLLAGKREDLSFGALLKLMDAAKITDFASPDAPERLRKAIGDGFVRTARTHYQAEDSPNLPVIATMLGPRVTSDGAATRPLVHPVVQDHHAVPATEIAYALGHDRALAYMGSDLGIFANLRDQLNVAREILRAPQTGSDLYSSWLSAITALSDRPQGTPPSFMEGDAFRDLRMDSAIAAYAQIRHNYILMVPTTMDEPGCEIPDGFVEPAPAVYEALMAYAERGKAVTARLMPEAEAYFDQLGRTLGVLDRISLRELANEPLKPEELRFLSMVTDLSFGTAGGYSSGPQGSGWYFRMFRSNAEALQPAALIADYFVSPYEGTAYYAGVKGVTMGIFVVDTAGGPRAVVGPVARAFEAVGPFDHRYSDAEANSVPAASPWTDSYVAPATPEPPLSLKLRFKADARDEWTGDVAFTARSTAKLGPVTLELLDHHRAPIASVTRDMDRPNEPVRFSFPSKKMPDSDIAGFGVEGLHVRVGDYHYFDVGHFEPKSYEPLELVSAGPWVFGQRPRVRGARRAPRVEAGSVAGRRTGR